MNRVRFGLLAYPGGANLGDAIQSLAAQQYLPRVDALVERERISQAPPPGEGGLRTILNGWFMHDAAFWPPHRDVEPLPISMHFVEPGVSHLRRWAKSPLERMLSDAGGEWLRHWGPIGARDRFTLEQLDRRGIAAYHSGCLTLTLPALPVARGDAVIACDLTPAALARMRSLTDRTIVEVTHLGGESLDHAGQQAAARTLLELYAGAAAVITTRIHAAQPCLALGAPVLLLTPPRAGRRISDTAELLHSCSEADFLAGRCEFDMADPPPNPETFRPLAAALAERCRAFVNRP